MTSPSNVLPYYVPQVNFPTNNLNFHWRWRWWDQIQAIFLNLFYFTGGNFMLIVHVTSIWYSTLILTNSLDVFQVLQQFERRREEGIEVICCSEKKRCSRKRNSQTDACDFANPIIMWTGKFLSDIFQGTLTSGMVMNKRIVIGR